MKGDCRPLRDFNEVFGFATRRDKADDGSSSEWSNVYNKECNPNDRMLAAA